jgi:predicted 3-demethylubiquinone-9 3-methyltransferase (glyoxalase superfamily)
MYCYPPVSVAIAPLYCQFCTASGINVDCTFEASTKKKEAQMATMQKITSNLWFDNQAEEAAKFYTSVFKNSKIGRIARYGKEGQEIHGRKEGSVMTIEFEIAGQQFVGLNGGPVFKFNEAVSFIVNCDTQEEIDYYWEKLSKGGDPKSQQCGWLKDQFGLSWQIVPAALPKMISDKDTEKTERVMKALLQMKKLDIKALERAYNGKEELAAS